MKRKVVEKLEPTKTNKKGLVATVQTTQGILVLNIYKDKALKSRYCMDAKTKEYQSWYAKDRIWTHQKLGHLCGWDPMYYGYYPTEKELKFNSLEEKDLICTELNENLGYHGSVVRTIGDLEQDYNYQRRERAEMNRYNRVKAVMDQVPELPADIKDWIWQQEGGVDFAFYDKESEAWSCTACGKSYAEKYLHRVDGGKKVRHNDMVTCPRCKKIIQAKKRTHKVEKIVHFAILQPINEKYSVARHFDVDLYWTKGKREVLLNESIRFLLFKLSEKPQNACNIYYNQYSTGGVYCAGRWNREYSHFDNKSNPANRKTFTGYLYDGGIEEALQDTAYETWTRIFCQLAAGGQKLQYNRLMCTQKDEDLQNVVECLYKGRFYRLLQDTAEGISYWACEYCGPLNKIGECIEDVFRIQDRQKINRIRDMDGGIRMLNWMRYSDEKDIKIPQETLLWLMNENLDQGDLSFIMDRMSLPKIMNYIKRQQAESYKGKNTRAVLSQWADYLSMCKRLKKKLDDEMVYRPRELKRRHDEAVVEIELREAQLQADEYTKRYPGAEDVLQEIKAKFEWKNEDYIIVVPTRLVDIVAEGRVLHHCVGSCDRYFDRIKSHETYVCFLRKAAEPETPYYTIEVEPGGTIRQHRGYLDEEPDIEAVKPVLREWQQAIKKRLTKKDREYAATSAIKRAENIEELKAKNNTRVLEGLMEDFMEAV